MEEATPASAVTIWGGGTGEWNATTGVLTITGSTVTNSQDWATVDGGTTWLSSWFEDCTVLTTIQGLNNVDTSRVLSFYHVFLVLLR